MVIDPRELDLRSRPPRVDDVILEDQPCKRCGYNLRGLARWTVCPECGQPIDPRASAAGITKPRPEAPAPLRNHVLVNADELPRGTKRRLAVGLTIAACGATLLAGPMALAWVLLTLRSQAWTNASLAATEATIGWLAGTMALPGSVLWSLGVLIVTPGKPPPPRNKAEAFAAAERLSGLMSERPACWPACMRVASAVWVWPVGCVAFSVAQGGASGGGEGLQIAGLVGVVAASLATALVCVHLREIALLFNDDFAVQRFEQSTFLLPVLILVIALVLFVPNMFAPTVSPAMSVLGLLQGLFLLTMFLVLVIWPVSRLLAGLWAVASSARWSITNDLGAEAAEARFVARSLAIEREANQRRAAQGGEID
jgi:hypothetical protein